ncbi:LAMI_0C06590g1_1 [Lachancea mirantina]|uniref:LAMI_0C06590g1_1 n=1 Tax=Lachancea mirantina TaxID=1230905 RepID=A0A1G4J3L9_9SACH|nr:LAMI_0C06590g1_1 [Lachancea mirantina]
MTEDTQADEQLLIAQLFPGQITASMELVGRRLQGCFPWPVWRLIILTTATSFTIWVILQAIRECGTEEPFIMCPKLVSLSIIFFAITVFCFFNLAKRLFEMLPFGRLFNRTTAEPSNSVEMIEMVDQNASASEPTAEPSNSDGRVEMVDQNAPASQSTAELSNSEERVD